MFTGWTGVALNPFNPNVLTARAELEFFLPLFFSCMSNLPNEPISQGVGGCEGEEGDSDRRRGDSFLLQEPAPTGGRSRAEDGERERRDGVTHVESVIYFFIIKKEGDAS